MKTHTAEFKENIKKIGRELKSVVTFELNGVDYEYPINCTPEILDHFYKNMLKEKGFDFNIVEVEA